MATRLLKRRMQNIYIAQSTNFRYNTSPYLRRDTIAGQYDIRVSGWAVIQTHNSCTQDYHAAINCPKETQSI